MNTVVTMHKGGLDCALGYHRLWRSASEGGRLIVLANSDIPHKELTWADEIVKWPGDPGHDGLKQAARHLRAFEIAASLPGITAVLDPDAVMLGPLETDETEFAGSRVWDATEIKNAPGIKSSKFLCRFFVHPPYVTNQAGWQAIVATLKFWGYPNTPVEKGHADRAVSLAAQTSGLVLSGNGWSRNTAAESDLQSLSDALRSGAILIHGVKNTEWLTDMIDEIQNGERPPTLWDKYGVSIAADRSWWAADLRHVNLLHRLLKDLRVKSAAEIGSFRGHSTVAFLEEAKRGMETHIVELNPTPELLRLLESLEPKQRPLLHQEPFWEANIQNLEFVFIDGDHQWPAIADGLQAAAQGIPLIAMHDTADLSEKSSWGAHLLARVLRQQTNRVWFEDNKERHGELTRRGFGLSVADSYLSGPAGEERRKFIERAFAECDAELLPPARFRLRPPGTPTQVVASKVPNKKPAPRRFSGPQIKRR